MAEPLPFPELLNRLRGGDLTAVQEFVARHETYLRRYIRRRLNRCRLQAVADSIDVCQSVLGTFLIRTANGEFELRQYSDIEKLLLLITKRKVAALVRREFSLLRDRNRLESFAAGADVASDSSHEPSRIASGRDLVEEIRRRLPVEERMLFDLRREDKSWDQIAAERNGNSIVLRKRLSRALKRISRELGWEDSHE